MVRLPNIFLIVEFNYVIFFLSWSGFLFQKPSAYIGEADLLIDSRGFKKSVLVE